MEQQFKKYVRFAKKGLPLALEKIAELVLGAIVYLLFAMLVSPADFGKLLSVYLIICAAADVVACFYPCYVKWYDRAGEILFNQFLLAVPLLLVITVLLSLLHLLEYIIYAIIYIILVIFVNQVAGLLNAEERYLRYACLKIGASTVFAVVALLGQWWLGPQSFLVGADAQLAVWLPFLRELPKPKIRREYWQVAFSRLSRSLSIIIGRLAEPAILLSFLPLTAVGEVYLAQKLVSIAYSFIMGTLFVMAQPYAAQRRYRTILKLLGGALGIYIMLSMLLVVVYKLGLLKFFFHKYQLKLEYLASFIVGYLMVIVYLFLELPFVYEGRIVDCAVAGTLLSCYWIGICLLTRTLSGILLAYATRPIIAVGYLAWRLKQLLKQ